MKTNKLYKIMKVTFIVLVTLYFIPPDILAQSPEKISYQAVIRNSSGLLLNNVQIGIQINILQGSANGTSVYAEVQTPTTNANGLITIEIGDGSIMSGNISNIDWNNGPFFIKTEIDPEGGTNYTISGTSQILSVPYAIHAKTAESITGTIPEADPLFSTSQAANITGNDIVNLGNLSGINTGDQDLSSFISIESDPVFNLWDKSYDDLTNTPNIMDSINTVLDTLNVLRDIPDDLAKGDLFVYNGTQLTRLPAGSENQVLTIKGGIPTWMYKSDIIDSIYTVYMNASDEDYINFGQFQNFTNNSDWCIIEKVKMPSGTGANGGWHFFRGKAWEDKEGDIAIQIKSDQVYAWVRKGGWQAISYNSTFEEEKWYSICFQYNASTQVLDLYVDGTLAGQKTGLAPMDDSGNTNNMYWGGQEAAASHGVGEIYSEASIIIAHQAWLQRLLTPAEIQNYNGYIAPESALFFSTEISSDSVIDSSGHGRNGVNGNTPEYIGEIK
jgi:hypothetical protein